MFISPQQDPGAAVMARATRCATSTSSQLELCPTPDIANVMDQLWDTRTVLPEARGRKHATIHTYRHIATSPTSPHREGRDGRRMGPWVLG